MRVLIGCEESGKGREAFKKRGHDAWSCDLLPSRISGNHLQCDIMDVLDRNWDLIILHPDCTKLAVSGNSTYGLNQDGTPKHRHHERLDAVAWTVILWGKATNLCSRVCLENPVGVLNSYNKELPKPKYVHPWQYGHLEQKKTGLWLYGLSELRPTNDVYVQMMELPKNQRERNHYMPPGVNRKRDRSESYQGIMDAMAEQWG